MTDVHHAEAATPLWRAHAHRLAAILVLVLAALGARESLALGLGEATQPGPGLWPFILCVFTGAAAAVLLVIDTRTDYEAWTRRSFRIVVGLAALGLFITAFGHIGFILPATALMLFWLRAFAAEPWRLAVPVAVGTAVSLHLIFVVALGVPFPAEPFGRGL
jgi:putative tricarboxylic transport membrane protein